MFTQESFEKFNNTKENILKRAPITLSISKEPAFDGLRIENAKNEEKDGLEKFFKVTPYSMDENSYWLDQGFDIIF